VSGDAGTVNGKLTLMRGARVDGRLENVNGALRLEGATVRGGIETVNGDVFVGAGSHVDGGILVEKPGGGSWRKSDRLPRITIESGAEVQGTLRFEREVELYVGAGAVVGPVEGVAPRRHELQ
jgi:cytoskeletal protein CcmA (bactofilin family)